MIDGTVPYSLSIQFLVERIDSLAGTRRQLKDDHHIGNIRGFICDSCNTGLGRLKNGENYLMNAVNYIKEHDTLV
jgi:hypothetical protein